MQRLTIVLILFLSAFCGVMTSLWTHHPSSDVSTTAMPETDSRRFHYPLTFVSALKNDPNPAPKVYKAYCSHCHAPNPMIPVHAPIVGVKADWASRKPLGIDILFKLSSEGYAGMPARGGCFECSDELLKKTIQYMLDKS